MCPDVPIELEHIINKTIAKNLKKRYQNVDEIYDYLSAISKEAPRKIRPKESNLNIEVDKKEKVYKFLKYIKREKKTVLPITIIITIALFVSIQI